MSQKKYFLIPDALISTSRDPSQKTDQFVKVLSALFGAPIMRRGKASFGEIGYNAKKYGFKSILIAHNVKRYGFSKLLFYKYVDGYYKKRGVLNYELLTQKEVHTPFDVIEVRLQTDQTVATSLLQLLRESLISYIPREFINGEFDVSIKNIVQMYLRKSPEEEVEEPLADLTFENNGEILVRLRGYTNEN